VIACLNKKIAHGVSPYMCSKLIAASCCLYKEVNKATPSKKKSSVKQKNTPSRVCDKKHVRGMQRDPYKFLHPAEKQRSQE
jgi:hypothetical protein